MRIYRSVLDLIGNTPIVMLEKLTEGLGARVALKLEFQNPGHSVKDRAALWMINAAERTGQLKPGMSILEPTSGNTGISLAMIAAVRGYRCTIVMPESMSLERRTIMKAYGAELVLTPASEGMAGAIRKAEQMRAQEPERYFMPMQFDNEHNSRAHRESTAREIFEDTEGAIDIFVAGVGTGGTISGTGEVLKALKPSIRVVAVEPERSPVLSGGSRGPHGIQGIGAGFVPPILNTGIYDEIVRVADEDAFAMARRAAREEGLLVGISSGAVISAALSLASRPEHRGRLIVGIAASSGERYLSTALFKE